jgi:hypothetical protein
VEGDFGDKISPIVKLTFIIFLLTIFVALDLEVEKMEVKTTFLQGDIDEEIYMKQPKGFAVKENKEMVCKMKKSL